MDRDVPDQPLPINDYPFELRRAFRSAVLQHLAKHGAQTLTEVERNSPWMLGLALEGSELKAGLELSRRRREIEPVGESGWTVETGEWSLTDLGRAEARKLTSRLRSSIATGSLVAVVVAYLSLADTLNISLHLSGYGWERWIAIGAAGIVVAGFLCLTLKYYRYGVDRGRIAREWRRYRDQRAHGYAFYAERRRMLFVFMSAVLILGMLLIGAECNLLFWLASAALSAILVTQWGLVRLFARSQKEWREARAST